MLGGYFLASGALKPVNEIINTARRISAEDLSARLNLPDNGDELGRLAHTFDNMLARLDDAFQRERQFTLDASHELRTPLAAMQAIIGVTRSQPRTHLEYENALDDLAEETDRLRALTEDLLLLARGQQLAPPEPEPVDLSALLEDVAETLSPLAEAKGLALECHVAPNLTIHSDRDSLIRLFVNLVDNAIKFTQSGKVTVAALIESGLIRIDVIDTGKGIMSEHLGHVFDRFYRVDAARAQIGAGLGLAIALQIARACGGDITVTSNWGGGTTFSVTLPVV
jgi:signal transduction histidine kinase